MPKQAVGLAVAQAILCYLYIQNLCLRGAWKRPMEGVLGLAIVATVVVAFVKLGWRWGLLFTVLPVVLVPLFGSLAESIARRLLK